MRTDKSAPAFRDACLAYKAGACAGSPCFECGPVHQALRIATVSLARWPRPLPNPPQKAR